MAESSLNMYVFSRPFLCFLARVLEKCQLLVLAILCHEGHEDWMV
uniref:Uncharacterized protein n=1 Tax=Rhizophora mucronata TaxID=61149 RepID=A0A2P2NG70_RHIMU